MTVAHLIYEDVPAEVSHVSAYRWQQGGLPVPLQLSMERDGTRISLTFAAVPAAIVLLQRGDGAYLLDGPLPATDAPQPARRVEEIWRRTLAGSAPLDASPASPVEWLPALGVTERWPACTWLRASTWRCLGVPLDSSGVVVSQDGATLLSAVANTESTVVLRGSRWGRLVIVSDRGPGPPPRLRVTAGNVVAPPAQRARAVRLETALLPDVRVTTVAPGVVWLAGDSSPPDAWIEVRSARSGPQFAAIADVAAGALAVPLYITLEDARTVIATVVSARNDSAAGALVTAFRLVDPPTPRVMTREAPRRRVMASETIAGADGTFRFDGLGEADYEIVAWHPQFGRGSVVLRPGDQMVSLRLNASGIARGRVLVGGKPAGGVDVIALPDPGAFMTAEDPIDLKAGDARTGPDGRFALALAPGGGGELRVGGGKYAVTRVLLPRAPLPAVELGDIVVGAPVGLSLVLDQDPGCQVRATGPIGRVGIQIVTAVRTGPGLFAITLPEEGVWEFGLLCGRDERPLTPAVLTVMASEGRNEIRFVVR